MTYTPHPLRIQRKRTKGCKLPEGAICVTRPGMWGNWFSGKDAVAAYREAWRLLVQMERGPCELRGGPDPMVKMAGKVYDVKIEFIPSWDVIEQMRAEIAKLRGKPLACFCPLTRACHADVLAEIANA